MLSYPLLCCVALQGIILLKLVHLVMKTSRLRKIMPPGPPGLPLLGNALQVGNLQWLQFTEWKEQYGSIFSINLAGRPVVVLNDFTMAADLLDRRSNIYSSRPRFIVAGEILTQGLLIAFLSYSDMWRRMRRATHESFSIRAAAKYQPLQEKESALLALRCLQDPDKWNDHLHRSAASTVLSVVYGWLSVDKSSDPSIDRIYQFMDRITHAALPGSYLVEIFPSMLYLPEWMAKWKHEGRQWFRKDTKVFEGLLADVQNKMRAGTAEPCFAATLLEEEEKYGLNTQEMAWLSGTMLGAGAETTSAALSFFMLAMVLYPAVVRKAQAQIDAVVGRDRLPTFGDRERLPYIEAIVKEVHRWSPVGPVGVPHCSTKDDWYKGYFIPKGTIVITNIWAMHRDPKRFPDFDEFRPERYLDDTGELRDSIPDTHNLGHMAYGTGRRICVGKDVANQTLFIDFATLLWAFNIRAACDADGHELTPSRSEVVNKGLAVCPLPFKCSITPREPEVTNIIHLMTDTFVKRNLD